MNQTENVLHTLEFGIQLKEMPRTGFVQRGVRNVENVASHTYSVALCALALLDMIAQPLDRSRVLEMVLLHDLPESLTSDIPAPVKRFFPDDIRATLKTDIERQAMHEITADAPFADRWNALWEEQAQEQTPEAQLAKDVDKLDMYLQAYTYELHSGNQRLAEFWSKPHKFYFAETQALYDLLVEKRQANTGTK